MSAITPEQWQKIKPIFHAALERPASARTAFLDEACAGEAALRVEIEALLAAHENTGSFIAQSAVAEAIPHLFAEPTELPAGQKLGGYEIQRKLGAGGMGEIYLVRDSRLGRPVALKVLPVRLTREAERVKRFQQEARAASALNHPNILTIYEVGEADGVHFMATEYIDGPTLRELLKRGELTLGQVLDIVTQAAQALDASHRAGIVHRDIKPENLMRRNDGFIKVLDFGLAKLTERPTDWATAEFSRMRTRPGVVMGTVTYMSPEQARGQEVDARSDVFSLGVVLYEMLTGRVPFEGETTSDVITSLLTRQPQPLDSFINGLPAAFQTIVERALQKRREDRYATVFDLLKDLRALKDELEMAAKLKRAGKAKSEELSLLEMRVGNSQESVARATNERRKGTTARFSTAVGWVRNRSLAVSLSGLLVLIVSVAGWLWYGGKWKLATGDLSRIDSIAVLPFADNTNETELNYLPDGLTESLITSLSRLPNLRVMATSSVMPYKKRTATPQQVGQELNVRAVVIGRIQKTAGKLLINVEMADVRDGSHLWSDTYERQLSDLLKTQNEIVREITQQLRLQLNSEQQTQLARPQPANNEAYQNYLKARFTSENAYTEADYNQALAYLRKALEYDPNFALAYTGIASCYALMADHYLPMAEAMPKARAALQRALELDPQSAEAHVALMYVYYIGDWNFSAAEASLVRALELNPNDASHLATYAMLLLEQGRGAEAVAPAQRALQLDSMSEGNGITLCRILDRQGRFEEAQAVLNQLLAKNPESVHTLGCLAAHLIQQGRLSEALEVTQRAHSIQRNLSLLTTLGYLHGRLGHLAEARKIAAEIEQLARKQPVPHTWHARVYVGLNEPARALAVLQKGYAARSQYMVALLAEPMLDELRHDPRFIALVKQVGLPQ